ncbi:MAG: GNAT family N-acetyltransferase [Armatimonadetes bacterium]|nr:GNAT family N-acetyltransferase [Armatimonadota bacterium]
MTVTIRRYREPDRARLLDITEEAFPEASLDRLIEQRYGVLNDCPWPLRKRAQVDADCDANPDGVFVAVDETGAVLGYITTRLWRETRVGWIPNLAVTPACQGQGIGRRLLEAALDYFRAVGMTHAKIETLAHNARGEHLYTSLGFDELARQIHFTMVL